MAENIDCFDCKHCEIIDDVFGIFNCDVFLRVWSGGACHDCEHYEQRDDLKN